MITPRQPGARQVQLANRTVRQWLQLGTQNIGAQVGDWPSDRHAVAALLDASPVSYVDGGFGRPVQVVQLRMWQALKSLALQRHRQRFTAAHNAPQRAALRRFVSADKGLQHRRNKMQSGDRLLDDQCRQLLRVAMSAGSSHHQGCAVHQRPEKLPHRHVKAERGFLQHPIRGVQFIGLLHPGQTVIQGAMAIARAFRATGGARGVNHIGQVLCAGHICQVRGAVLGQPMRRAFKAQTGQPRR